MSEIDLYVGDLVAYFDHGLTVESVAGDTVTCVWIDRDGERHREQFPRNRLALLRRKAHQ